MLAFALGCYGPGARLSAAVAGCYAVRAANWSDNHTRVTGFHKLPGVIALDTTYLGRVLVPIRWREADSPGLNSARLQLYSHPWRREGDSLVLDSYEKPRWLSQDSVIVTFSGWGGSVVTYLAREGAGFHGSGFVYPRQLAADAPTLRLGLEPTSCPSDLG